MPRTKVNFQINLRPETIDMLRRVVLLEKLDRRDTSASEIAQRAIEAYLKEHYQKHMLRIEHDQWMEKHKTV